MMFCTRCGQPLEPSTGICSVCGESQITQHDDGFVNTLKSNLASNLMLLMCIVISVATVLSFFNILSLLLTVSLWMTYASAKSTKPMSITGLKMTSVTITITRVLVWIAVGLLAILGIVFLAFSSTFSGLIANTIVDAAMSAAEAQMAFTIIFVFFGIFFLIFAALYTAFNIFFYGSVSKSVKSVINSFKEGKNLLVKTKAVMIWLIVLGVMIALEIPLMLIYLVFAFAVIEDTAFGLLFLFAILALLVSIAAYIIGALLSNKIGKTKPETETNVVIPI